MWITAQTHGYLNHKFYICLHVGADVRADERMVK